MMIIFSLNIFNIKLSISAGEFILDDAPKPEIFTLFPDKLYK